MKAIFLKDAKLRFLIFGISAAVLVFFRSAFQPLQPIVLKTEGHPQYQTPKGRFAHLLTGNRPPSSAVLMMDEKSTADLRLGPGSHVRVLPGSEIQIKGPCLAQKVRRAAMILFKGQVLAATSFWSEPFGELEILSGDCQLKALKAVFSVKKEVLSGKVKVDVLDGEVKALCAGESKEPVIIPARHSWIRGDSAALPAAPISAEVWREIYNAYQIIPYEYLSKENQLKLLRQCGNLFNSTQILGDFYTARNGFLQSFLAKKDGPARIQIYYDLQTRGAFAGVYFQMKEMVLEGNYHLRLESRRMPGQKGPKTFRIEFKSGYQLIQSFSVWNPGKDWKLSEIPFSIRQSTEITEIVLLFSDPSAGPEKSGYLELRGFDLVKEKTV